MNGFEIVIGSKAWFIITDKVKKTDKLCAEILDKIGAKNTPENIKALKYYMVLATLEYRDIPNCPYYRVYNKYMNCIYPVSDYSLDIINLKKTT